MSRPTAKYLKQHRFISVDKAEALKTLLPLIHNTRAYMAELAAASSAAPAGADKGGGLYACLSYMHLACVNMDWKPSVFSGMHAGNTIAGTAPTADGTFRQVGTTAGYGSTMLAKPKPPSGVQPEPIGGTFVRHDDVEQTSFSVQHRGVVALGKLDLIEVGDKTT